MIIRLFLLSAMALAFAAAQDKTPSVQDGVYSGAQAARGEAAYAKNCASCHGEKLEGAGQAPPLTSDEFTSNYNGLTLFDLFDRMQSTMPADRPGQLAKTVNADILAFILKSNQFPAGTKELPADADALKQIHFDSKKPRR